MRKNAHPAKLIVQRSAFERVIVTDAETDETSYLEQEEFASDRRAFERGEFSFVGLRARIQIKIPYENGTSILHVVESPGLWGIPTNSDPSYFDEVFEEESATLEHMLTTLGVAVQP